MWFHLGYNYGYNYGYIYGYNAQYSLHKGVRVLNPSKLGFTEHSPTATT